MKTLIVLALLLAIVTSIVSALFGAAWPERVVQTILTPIRSGFNSLTRMAERYYNYVFDYETLEAENQHLQERIIEIENEIRSADALERENERLRTLLNLSEEHTDYQFCAAYIISWESSNWKNRFTIGKGTNSGLAKGMVAVTEHGQVLGLITEVGTNWAEVTTILDPSLEISASIASSGHTGVIQGAYLSGDADKLRMNYLPSDAVLRNNDQVVTTGSSLYPRNLILGYIVDAGFDESGVAKYAMLQPAADFDSLEQIFIITQYVSQ